MMVDIDAELLSAYQNLEASCSVWPHHRAIEEALDAISLIRRRQARDRIRANLARLGHLPECQTTGCHDEDEDCYCASCTDRRLSHVD